MWMGLIGRNDLLAIDASKRKNYRVCDVHFHEDTKFLVKNNRTNLKRGSIPSLFLNCKYSVSLYGIFFHY
jgi:hypothetical protein